MQSPPPSLGWALLQTPAKSNSVKRDLPRAWVKPDTLNTCSASHSIQCGKWAHFLSPAVMLGTLQWWAEIQSQVFSSCLQSGILCETKYIQSALEAGAFQVDHIRQQGHNYRINSNYSMTDEDPRHWRQSSPEWIFLASLLSLIPNSRQMKHVEGAGRASCDPVQTHLDPWEPEDSLWNPSPRKAAVLPH